VSESVIGSGRIRTENSAQERDNLCIAETGATFSVLSDPTFSGTTVPAPSRNFKGEIPVNFLDDSLFPENQEKLVITAAPYGPEWEPADFPEDIPLTMDQHVQQAVDCWEAGATVLQGLEAALAVQRAAPPAP
jgi:hypothetical protein